MDSKLTLNDTYLVKNIQSPALSPDGEFVAFVLSEPIRGMDGNTENLWIVSTRGGEPYRLTRNRAHDAHPQWSPDGRYLAFLSDRPKELELIKDDEWEKAPPESKHAQIWIFDRVQGGEPRQLTDRDEGVASFDWAPDGSAIVFAGRDPSEEEAQYLKAIRDEKKPGPLVIDRVQHKADGEGYLDNVKTHLFVADLTTRAVRRLTNGASNEEHPGWSPDGRWILFASNRTGDADNNRRTDLWLINPEGSETRRLTQGDVGAHDYAFSPNGLEVAFISSVAPENSYVLDQLCVVRVEDAAPIRSLSEAIGQGWSSIGGIVADQLLGDPVNHARVYPVPLAKTPLELVSKSYDGTFSRVVGWTDDQHILALAHHRAQQKLVHFGLDGAVEALMPEERIGTVVDADANAAGMVAVYNRPEHGRELYAATDGRFQRLTFIGEWLNDRTLGTYHWIQYPNHDGETIEALVLAPPGFDRGRDHAPLLVNIHGGPMWYDTPQFEFDTQYWANRGYLVLMVNYRGSISYGEPFCQSIQGDWGPREHDDVMSGVDYLVSEGWTREDQLFCTGFSQGGIMTNWAVGHTDRFRAAVSEHGMWDYLSAFGTDDCHLWWQDDLGVPWQNAETYYRISPMSGLMNIRTPLLITAGEHDWRCPLNQAEELYVALKKRGVPTELVIYPGEHHAITRPSRAIDRLERIDRWLARYGGIPAGGA